jgi:hypothetical protein
MARNKQDAAGPRRRRSGGNDRDAVVGRARRRESPPGSDSSHSVLAEAVQVQRKPAPPRRRMRPGTLSYSYCSVCYRCWLAWKEQQCFLDPLLCT